ncbi:MAG: hypothetical protein AB1486_18015 [Planctomycetota bacterium]
MDIDHTVYPDVDEPPEALPSAEERADYVQRICAAWDFYIPPDAQTFALFSGWKDVFDMYPLPASPAYHAFRAWFGWDPVPYPVGVHPPTPVHVHIDRLEGRPPDPCEGLI